MTTLTCFKAYDIRGRLGEELNEDIAYRIGRAFAQYLRAKRVVIGGDVRLSSSSLKHALAKGLMASGADVIDIGMVGTEEVYFATQFLEVDGGIEVTASHNPMDYNGMKLVREHSKPISGDTGLNEIRQLAESNRFDDVVFGRYSTQDVLPAYIEHLCGYIDMTALKPLRLVVNSGNGAAGHVVDALEQKFKALNVPISFIKIHHEADGNFPNGIPNPLLPERRQSTQDAVIKHGADMGIAWDGDFDRCFLFDETGAFIEGYYIVGLLAEVFTSKHPGSKVIHDPRLIWNTQDIVNNCNGTAVMSKTGHAFIKERMRQEDAIYGGEMSAHHYFRDFGYCDSGMIPWLLVCELLVQSQQSLSLLVAQMIERYPSSGELNFHIDDPKRAISLVEQHFDSSALAVDRTDGLSMSFDDGLNQWRFNLRCSNTEPVVRLNVESRGNRCLMAQQTDSVIQLLKQ
ncbi:phosphomannomutase CpsG [Ferrimonas lipolytica]|uniref:phosphomannomutase n=1 Tax=Ferrimonas lipolytica TaxID=2724191 RepID=A0A6H1UL52_9GAMM|nr:phosphomannomutase CpsG [Ferrimonas lipolytica]QIZ78956.1 phosphomannomutase CpsG [Ferrimonas lipolytica]